MPTSRRCAAAAALILAALASAGTAALAQETSNTVGPPQLKDFQLPGQRTTPPATRPTPPPPPPPPAATTPPPSAEPRTQPAPSPAPARRAEPEASVPPPAPASPEADIALPAEEATNLATGPVEEPVAAETNVTVPLPPPILPDAQLPPPLVPDAQQERSWLVPAVAGACVLLLLGLGLIAWLRRRRRREETIIERTRGAAREELGGALFTGAPKAQPEPGPAPETLPAPSPEPEVAAAVAAAAAQEDRRAWLEIDIKPDRAAATDTDASVQYALIVRNRGSAIARNIRIDAKLFNASAEQEVAAFFEGPIHEQSGSPHVTIAPDGRLTLMGQAAMPKAEAQEIELNGVRIFVPMVAINVAYDWKGGSGRTSRSWVVGRESEATDKMGPFRLDLGPRIYRSVGRREAKLAMV